MRHYLEWTQLSIKQTVAQASPPHPRRLGFWIWKIKRSAKDFLTIAGTNTNNKVSQLLNDDKKLGSAARVGLGSKSGADGKLTATTNSIGRGVTAFLNAYPTPNAFTFDVSKLVTFHPAESLGYHATGL
jgi:hypothetical protein